MTNLLDALLLGQRSKRRAGRLGRLEPSNAQNRRRP